MKYRNVLVTMLAIGFAHPGFAKAKLLTIAWDTPPRTIDPRYAVDANSQYLENLVHCSLVDFDPAGKTVGDLAAGWEWVAPKVLAVKLKSSAKFSNGQPVTGDDVAATFRFFLEPGDKLEGMNHKKDAASKPKKKPSPRKGAFAKVESVTAVKNVVTFVLSEPDTTFPTNLVVGVLPKGRAANDMFTEAGDSVGCGPFQLVTKDVSGLKLRRNPHYGLGGRPKVDGVNIKFVADETTRFAKLRAGEVDIVQNTISRDTVERIGKSYPNLRVLKRPGLNTAYLGFNMRDKIVGKQKVRAAIAHAINREKIIKYILRGLAVPAATLLTPADPFYDKSVRQTAYDVDKAKKLLDQAGFKDPDGDGPKKRFTLTYKTTTNETRVTIAKAIAADLKKVGIEIKVQPLEWGRFKEDVEKGKVQMWSLKWVGFKDPDIFRYVFSTESFPPNGGNRGWYSNKKLDDLMAKGRTQTKMQERQKTYQEIQKIVSEERPYVFLWHEELFAVINKKVRDFELYADGRLAALTRAYLE